VAGWGNLVNRSLSLVHKNLGAIPAPGELTGAGPAALEQSSAAFAAVGAHLQRSQQKAAITEAMRVVGEANKYLSDQAPWKLKDDPARRDTRAARRAAAGRRRQGAAHAVPAGVRRRGRRDARRRPPVGRPARAARGRGPRRRARATRC
jgi:methionyl-tRNA synthetase